MSLTPSKEYIEFFKSKSLWGKTKLIYKALMIPIGVLHELQHIFWAKLFRMYTHCDYAFFKQEGEYVTTVRMTYYVEYYWSDDDHWFFNNHTLCGIVAIAPLFNYVIIGILFGVYSIPIFIVFHQGLWLSESDKANAKQYLFKQS